MAARIDTAAENCMVRVPEDTSQISRARGMIRYACLAREDQGTISDLGIPFRPSFFASRWTAMKMPVKYSRAGRMAFTATWA